MRPYETLLILSNELGEEIPNMIERLQTVIESGGGNLEANHDWGSRRLAYPIHKQRSGHYFLLEYQAEPPVVRELERTLRIAEGVLRFLSVQQEHTGLPRMEPPEAERSAVPLSELRASSPSSSSRTDSTQAESPVRDGAASTSSLAENGAETGESGTAGADGESGTAGADGESERSTTGPEVGGEQDDTTKDGSRDE